MIDPRELRYGIFLSTPTGIRQVTGFDFGSVSFGTEEIKSDVLSLRGNYGISYDLDQVEGIPFTPDWRDKWPQAGPVFGNKIKENLPHIRFVHQIQNLYYDLTGTELEEKDARPLQSQDPLTV